MAATSLRRNSNQSRSAGSYAEDASKLIRENMKCPVCLEVLLPPIYQCETGHNICHLCVDEVTECPLCKSDYGDTRNYFAEELVNSMSFPCKYEEYGCHKTFLGSQLKDHQTNCEFQPYRCPELACQEVVGIHQIGKHLDKHGFKVMKGDAHQASVEILDDHFERKTEYNPWRISAFGTEFYTVSTRSREGLWYFWAYGLGLQKNLRKFSYEIVLYSEEKQIMYRGIIQSLRNSPEDIMKNGNCLISNDQMIKSLRKNGRINCQVYFIQGKNWDAARGARSNDAKRNAKNLKNNNSSNNNNNNKEAKKKTCPPPKEKQQTNKSSKPNTPSLANVNSTPPPCLTGVNQKCPWLNNGQSRSRASAKESLKNTSSNDTTKKEWGWRSNNRTSSKTKLVNGAAKTKGDGKNTKPPVGSTTTRPNGVTDDEHSFVQRVRETLRCPSCNEVITPPVFQCLIGHNVCHKCKMARQDCSLCLSPLTDCRNFFAEELLYKTYQRCLYYKYGCKVCLPSAHMKSHEMVCDYAPFECPFNVCRALLRSDDLLEHMKTHQISTVDKELKHAEVFVPRNPPGSHVCIIPNILTVDKVAFYPIIVQESDGSWLFYVITNNYPKYRFELMIKKQAKTLAFQGPVVSLRSNLAQVKLKGNGLILTDRAVRSLKANEKLTYQINVRKIETTVTDGSQMTESILNLPMSWVLTPRSGEIVSKTELFANKKTSVSPNDDSENDDDDDDGQSSVHRQDSERDLSDINAESDEDESDLPIHSEGYTISGTSVATTNQGDDFELEIETRNSLRTQDSREYIRIPSAPLAEAPLVSKFSEHSIPQLLSLTPSLSSFTSSNKKAKKVTRPETQVLQKPTSPPEEQPSSPPEEQPTSPPEEQPTSPPEEKPTSPPELQPTSPPELQPTSPPEEASAEETFLASKQEDAACSSSTAILVDFNNTSGGVCSSSAVELPMDSNSNLEMKRSRVSRESLVVAGNLTCENRSAENLNSQCYSKQRVECMTSESAPISILKPTSVDNSLLLRAGNSSSVHSLKMTTPTAAFVTSQSSSLISADPLLTMPQKILKKGGRQSRSTSKHRVRLSDQVICREVNDSMDEDVNGNSNAACKSQMNLRLLTSKTSIRTVPSKHVLSVEIRPDGYLGEVGPVSVKNEFQQLRQALSSHDASSPFMEESTDLLTAAKSLSEMTDAVISGSFDVVKSVMSLFTSESSKTGEPRENGENPPAIQEQN